MSYSFKLVTTAVCIALGVLLPMIFHMAGFMGAVFLPMHIPVLIAGLFLGSRSGLITGILTPVLSTALTGMPPAMPTLPIMVAELATYGMVSGYLYHRRQLSLLLSLVIAMIAGRIAAGIAVFMLAQWVQIQMTPIVYLYGALVTGLPGMVMQLIMIPLLVRKLLLIYKQRTRPAKAEHRLKIDKSLR